MPCKPCAERRKKWLSKQREKRDRGRKVQAAAIGAALAVTEAAGKAIGIKGEETNEQHHNDQDRSA